MTYTRMRNQELSIKLKPSTSSSNIMYYPELVYNDVKKFIEETGYFRTIRESRKNSWRYIKEK